MFKAGQTVILKKAEGKRCIGYGSANIYTPTGRKKAEYCEGMQLIVTEVDINLSRARVNYPGRKQRVGNWVELHHLVPAIQLKRRKNV